ncbi:hypothetical protein AB0C52_13970 [Streptomyces sp. NPDC048717]|uniref:hypothetical protein n=1 Tax=Streptomyces sp. NPDC048717 TaxID=3154928 RepID=UPI0034289AE9
MLTLPRFIPTPVFRLLGLTCPPDAVVQVLPGAAGLDSVLRVVPPSPGRTFILALDVRGRRDPERARGWTVHLPELRERYALPTVLLAVCADRSAATWAAGPFTTGFGCRPTLSLRPLVLSPANTPPVTTVGAAHADLAGAAFAALAHARGSRARTGLTALAEALRTAAPETRAYCVSLLETGLGDILAGATWHRLTAARRPLGELPEGMPEGPAQGTCPRDSPDELDLKRA